ILTPESKFNRRYHLSPFPRFLRPVPPANESAPGHTLMAPKRPHFHGSAPTTRLQPESPLSTNSAKMLSS
ncbi:MAG: hypothetical protein ACXAB7_24015, partial [Candidatus Kariarchaeaceae archaeon]